MGLAALVNEMTPSKETVYDVIGLPPFPGTPPTATGAVKEIVACPFPLTAFTLAGQNDTVDGVIDGDDADGPVPIQFVAVTLKV
jgi:hypothetical protein